MFEHTMDVVKNWDSGHRLDAVAALSSSVTIEAYEGRVVHRTAGAEFEMGCKADKVPFVLLSDSKAEGAVVTSQARNPGAGWQGYGKFNRVALCCLQAYEIATTEFVPEATTGRAYAIDQYLTARASNTDQATGGMLTNRYSGLAVTVPTRAGGTTVTVCGIVSQVPRTLQNGNTVLFFYTAYMPGSDPTTAAST